MEGLLRSLVSLDEGFPDPFQVSGEPLNTSALIQRLEAQADELLSLVNAKQISTGGG